MTNREFILEKLESKHIIWRFCKRGSFSYQLANDGRTVYKTLHNNNGKVTENKIHLQSALKQLTAHIRDIMHFG